MKMRGRFFLTELFYFGFILFAAIPQKTVTSTLIKEIRHNNVQITEINTKTTNPEGVDKVINAVFT